VIRDKSKNEIINNVIMEIFTHLLAHKPLLGTPVEIVEGKLAIVKLVAIENMVVDERGLVHGGFTFGLADYAAMLAVNNPNVVISSANVQFTSPVKRGDIMVAEAKVVEVNKSKWVVEVEVRVDENTVLSGKLLCYVLEKHVLDR
jgi:uncharacterized protein (TIGR00369 family)